MKATLDLFSSQSNLVRDVRYENMQVYWTVEVNGRKWESTGAQLSGNLQSLILLELAGIHARYHARVEPTFLLLDGFTSFLNSGIVIAALEHLQCAAEHAQVAIVSVHRDLFKAVSSDWIATTLETCSSNRLDTPVDFEVAARTVPQ
ncbi:hypothetical protein [Amycolatopsis pigmentata]|uniref:Uncharacterized protein n=1 Tax=Amycolatopsis pigmentata TaxID=450801 RepID=A0ABW5FIK3_9PSEU